MVRVLSRKSLKVVARCRWPSARHLQEANWLFFLGRRRAVTIGQRGLKGQPVGIAASDGGAHMRNKPMLCLKVRLEQHLRRPAHGIRMANSAKSVSTYLRALRHGACIHAPRMMSSAVHNNTKVVVIGTTAAPVSFCATFKTIREI